MVKSDASRSYRGDRIDLLTATNYWEVLLSIVVIVGLIYGAGYLALAAMGPCYAIMCDTGPLISGEALAILLIWLFRRWRSKNGNGLLKKQ
ncbi:MAG TPA: hypothetical protein VGN17_04975 [Bryobacteraceae bacterium]